MKKTKLKKEFGRAKLFEIRRIVRRIKQLSLKKGTTQQLTKNKRKIERLEVHLEYLKETQLEAFMEAIDAQADDQGTKNEKRDHNDVKSLVMSKLLGVVRKSEIFKDGQLNIIEGSLTQTSSGSSKQKHHFVSMSQNVLHSMEIKEQKQNKDLGHETVDRDLVDSCSDPETLEYSHKDSPGFFYNSFCDFINEKEKRDEKKGRKRNREKTVDVSINDSEVSSGSEEVGDKPSLSLDSVFVGSLSSGRRKMNSNSTKEGKGKQNGKKQKFKELKKKGNRLGQRQRREQWEKLYGKKANHLKNEKMKDHLNKSKRHIDRRKINDIVSKKKSKNTVALHPSWEASKRKQKSIVAFEGKKITFDD